MPEQVGSADGLDDQSKDAAAEVQSAETNSGASEEKLHTLPGRYPLRSQSCHVADMAIAFVHAAYNCIACVLIEALHAGRRGSYAAARFPLALEVFHFAFVLPCYIPRAACVSEH